jgi:CheY-like chemotaxis protein
MGVPSNAARLLIVEDNELVRRLAVLALRHEGHVVVEAAAADSGLELLSDPDAPFDLLVTDLVLPGINGYELAERALAASPGLRVLFVSGYAAPETMPPICGAAATHFLQKPYQPARLAAAVAGLLAVGGPDTPSGESSLPDACRLGRRVAVDI